MGSLNFRDTSTPNYTPSRPPAFDEPDLSNSGFMGPCLSRRRPSSSKPDPPYAVPYFANAVYYPNWRIYKQQPPSSLRLGFVSHVFYAFAWVKEDGTVYVHTSLEAAFFTQANKFWQLSDEWADSKIPVDGTEGCLRAFAQLKQQYSEMKVILSVGGGGEASFPFAKMTSNSIAMENFANTAKTLVDEFGLDGIDIDWEHPTDRQQGINYVHLLARLRDRMPSPRYLLTIALPAGEWALCNIDLKAAQTYLDFINVMAYDFSGPWTEHSGHQSQLYAPRNPHDDAAKISGHSAVDYMLSMYVPAKKILLGIPVYGRSFLGANGAGQAYSGHGGEDGYFEYRDLPRPNAIEHHDDEVVAAYCVGKDCGFVTYDTPETVKQKAAYASKSKLGGLFYWHVGQDARGPRSLIETGYNALHEM